jgi:ATPase family associated with various cellular activities (AAA)
VGIPGRPRGSLGDWTWATAASVSSRPEFEDAARLAGWVLSRAAQARAAQARAAQARAAQARAAQARAAQARAAQARAAPQARAGRTWDDSEAGADTRPRDAPHTEYSAPPPSALRSEYSAPPPGAPSAPRSTSPPDAASAPLPDAPPSTHSAQRRDRSKAADPAQFPGSTGGPQVPGITRPHRAVTGTPPGLAVAAHLGPGSAAWPVTASSWPAWDQVNMQAGLDAWLAEPGRWYQRMGPGGPDRPDGLAVGDLAGMASPSEALAGAGQAAASPAGGVYLVEDDDGGRLAVQLRGPAGGQPAGPVTLQVIAPDRDRGQQVLGRLRALAAEHSVYRGQVLAFTADGPGGPGDGPAFLDRTAVDRSQVVLPAGLLDGIERQVLGITRHAQALRANGQHLKRGVLLHGPPGTGKSHVVRYLLGQLPGVTAIVLAGAALPRIGEACALARALQPAVVVVEDVDLIAAQRRPGSPSHPLLFQLLNEIDGLGADADVAFVLTTSRADLLEEALAARPGRVDHVARLPLPDAAARRRLLRVYQGHLQFSRATAATVVARTDGVSASFMKEVLRRAALHAAARPVRPAAPGGTAGPDAPLRVSARHFTRALEELLDSSQAVPGLLPGGPPARGADAVIRPVLSRLSPTR